jgi:quercetin dioxygenase-like cupin family protein
VDEANALRHEQGWQNTGHSAKTLVKHQDLRIILIAMQQGTVMKEHQTSGSISIQVLAGQLRVHVGQRTFDIPAGRLLALDRALAHDVEALEDSTCVLSVCADPLKRRAR